MYSLFIHDSTIGSIVNSMMGTTLVAFPFAFYKTGFSIGIFTVILVGACGIVTIRIILETANTHPGPQHTEFINWVRVGVGGYE